MQIGDKVKIKRKRKVGEIYYDEKSSTQEATVVEIYKNFVVVQYKKGYRECFPEKELIGG